MDYIYKVTNKINKVSWLCGSKKEVAKITGVSRITIDRFFYKKESKRYDKVKKPRWNDLFEIKKYKTPINLTIVKGALIIIHRDKHSEDTEEIKVSGEHRIFKVEKHPES